MFSHTFLLFQLLLSYFSIFAKSLLTNFLAPFLGCTGIQFLVLFLVPLALRGSMSYMHPHISGTECIGFSKQDTFRLLPKVSEVNVHWANANHTFLTHKNPQTDTFLHDISLAKLRSTAQVWNPQGIFKLVNKVDCWVFALCSKQQCGPSLLRNPSRWDPQRTPAIWHASQSQSQGTSYL